MIFSLFLSSLRITPWSVHSIFIFIFLNIKEKLKGINISSVLIKPNSYLLSERNHGRNIIIIIWGVSRSRQQSRCYIPTEHWAALKIRHKAWHSQKCKRCRTAKSRRLGKEKRQTLTGRHWRQGRVKPITGHRISRTFIQDMGNRKANLTTAANRGSLTSHQITVCKTSMTDTETGQGNF